MANQIIIDIGAVANDGTGDPLRTAFGYVNDNFSNIWATGVANSNVAFSGNKILTTNTNGNLVLAPNGIGKVQANVDIVPNANNTLNLGSLTNKWNTVYTQFLEIGGSLTTNDLTVDGNLTVTGNIIQIGNLVTDAKTIQLSNTALTTTAANGSGITVGANDDIATFLYNSSSNIWTTNIGLVTTGNITAPYFIGNGALLTGVTNYGNSNVAAYLASGTNTSNIVTTNNISANNVNFTNDLYGKTGTFSGDAVGDNAIYAGHPLFTVLGSDVVAQFAGDVNAYTQFNFQNGNAGAQASGDYVITADNGNDTTHFLNIGITSSTWDGTQPNSLGNRLGPNDGYLYIQDGDLVIGTSNGTIETWKFGQDGVLTAAGNIDTTGNISATSFIGDGSQLTGISNYGNANAVAYGEAGWAGNIIPAGNNTQSLGNVTNQWSDLYVSNATIYMNNVPLSLTAGNVLTINGQAVLSNDSTTSINTTGSITAEQFIGNSVAFGTSGLNRGDDNYIVYEGLVPSGIRPSNPDLYNLGNVGYTWQEVHANVYYGDGSQLTGLSFTSISNDGSIVDILVPNGDVTITADSTQTWTFGTDGNLVVPNSIYGTNSGAPIVVDAGTTSDSLISIPSFTDGGEQLVIKNKYNSSLGIRIETETGNFTFSGGSLTFPDSTTQSTAYTGATYGDSNVTSLLSSLGSNTISSTANITTTANISGGYILGNAAFMTGIPASYGNANVADFLDSLGSNAIVTTGNISGGNLLVTNATMTGNLVVNTSISSQGATDLWLLPATGTTRSYGNINPFFANTYDLGGSSTRWNNVFANVANVVTLNTVGNINGSGATFSGNVTAANFSGNISITGNVTGTSPNVSLVAGSYTYTFDNTGVLSLPAVGGDEGGEIRFGIPTANTTLTDSVKVDVYRNQLRFFDGSTNGAYLDLANCPSGISAAVGYRDIPQISFSANATATGNAAGCHYYSTTAGNLQLTIPDNSNVAFPTGATLTIVMNAAGNVIVAQGTGVTLYMAGSSTTGNRTVGAYGLASVMKVAANTWVISGTGVY